MRPALCPFRTVLRFRGRLLLSVLCLLLGPLPAKRLEAQEPPSLVVGPVISNPHTLYNGSVQIRSSGETTGGQYIERIELGAGFQAAYLFNGRSAGDLRLALHGYAAKAEGTYQGLAPRETLRRDYLSIGADFGWRPVLWGGRRAELRVPFGPSLIWQRLRLSQGHRDKYGDPVGFTTPDVDWDDRTWVSLGGHAGLLFDLPIGERLGLVATVMTRLTYVGNSSWERKEQEAIQRSTGRTVLLNYEDPIVLSYGFQGGIKIEL